MVVNTGQKQFCGNISGKWEKVNNFDVKNLDGKNYESVRSLLCNYPFSREVLLENDCAEINTLSIKFFHFLILKGLKKRKSL
jgi:hypothetical protein